MEPGLRDREYLKDFITRTADTFRLQWSPVLETGNTGADALHVAVPQRAAMEPGLRDREYDVAIRSGRAREDAAMEPGLRDREYLLIVDQLRYAAPAAMEPGLRDREYGTIPQRLREEK